MVKNGGGYKIFLRCREQDILAKHCILLRKTEYHTNCNHKIMSIFYKIRLRSLQNRYSLYIPLNCCGEGLRIMHLGPILINEKATLGKNCKLHINTGVVAGGSNDEVPCIGDGCVIGMGAIITGGIVLANNIAVGANALVNKSFTESNIAIAGVPARKISNNGSLSWGKHKEN